MALTTQELQTKLWQAADILRGQIDSADYKNYIFSVLFLKRLSDRFDEEVDAAVAAGVPRDVALTDMDEHQFAVPEAARWDRICSTSMNLGEALNVAGSAIEEANAGRLDGVLGAPTGTMRPGWAARSTGRASSAGCSTTSATWICGTGTWTTGPGGPAPGISWGTPTST